jgi:exopolysaccharide production protein ExoQ
MPPSIATIIFAIGIAGLFYLDRDKKVRVSKALWIPALWLFFCLSRSASQWLGVSPPPGDMASVYLEGSPIDRAVFIGLEVAALIVVIARRRRVGSVLLQNWPICLFFSYAAFSIAWSDYSLVTLKHWIKGVGDLMMVLIVLTEQNVPDAIKRLFTRLAFVLVPLSILFYKYYPDLGRVLNLSWVEEPVGVATQKNSLGELCNILGLAMLWRFRVVYRDREGPNRKRRLIALGAVLAMVGWLLWICNSMTSICALSMASVLMLASMTATFRRRRAFVHVLIVALLSSTLYALFFQSSGDLIQSLGRNATLTGRTDIWKLVLSMPSNPALGVGYESFWLGARLDRIWDEIQGLRLNESHNGYIEVVITLGWIGVGLLGTLIVTGYQNVISARRYSDVASLKMAFFLATIITGLTEAAFRMMGPPWIVFLLAIAAVPAYAEAKNGRRIRVAKGRSPSVQEPAVVRDETPVSYYRGHGFSGTVSGG